jgi:hypothetical protein
MAVGYWPKDWRLGGELAALQERRRNNAIAIAVEGYSPDLEERRKVLSAEIAELHDQLTRLDSQPKTVSPAETAKLIRERFAAKKSVSMEERRRLLAETVESIVVQGDESEEIAVNSKFRFGIK